jgi:checkpoint serine/threonine-protein kinase
VEPLARLKKRYEAFQARMLLPRPEQSSSDQSGSGGERPATVRPVLAGSSLFQPTSSASGPKKNNGATSFAVFTDADGTAASEKQESGWHEFGTKASRKKENEREATAWKGERMPMKGLNNDAAHPPQVEKLEVFHDEDAGPPPSSSSSGGGLGGVDDVFTRHGAPTEAELLRGNPFKNYKDPVKLGDIPKPDASSSGKPTSSASASAKGASKAPLPTRVASPLSEIYPGNGQEFSLEEIIARKRGWKVNEREEWEIEAEKGRGMSFDYVWRVFSV